MKKLNLKMFAYKLAFISVVLLIIFSVGCAKKDEKEIKIGAILPLTGDLASYGENAKEGIILLSEEINEKGGINGRKIKVIFEDSKGQPDQGVAAIQKLINIDKVIAIIGDVASSPTLAFAPIANNNKIVVVSPAASSPDITNAGPYIYRVWPSDVFEADCMADFVKKQNMKTISIFYVNNDYGIAMKREFENLLVDTNISIVSEETFDQNTNDVRAQLTRIKKVNPEYIYLISYPKDSIIILKQYKELGLKSKILSTSSFEDPLIIKEVGNIAEGTIFTSPVSADINDPIVSAFSSAYEKRFEKKPGLVSDYGYDSLGIILEACKLSNEISKEGVFNGIQKIKDFNGATGLIDFDQNGDVIKPAGIKTIKEEKYIWLEKFERL